MRSGTKLVKTASRSTQAGGGEQGRLLDDCKAPEASLVITKIRLGQAAAPPVSSSADAMAGLHLSSKTQQLYHCSGQAGSR